jgi:hypothetical protein
MAKRKGPGRPPVYHRRVAFMLNEAEGLRGIEAQAKREGVSPDKIAKRTVVAKFQPKEKTNGR